MRVTRSVPERRSNCRGTTPKATRVGKVLVVMKARLLLCTGPVKTRSLTCTFLILAAAACGPNVPSGLDSEMIPTYSPPEPARDAAASSAAAELGDAGALPSDAGTSSADGVDAVAVLESIARNGYATSAAFTQVTLAPYASAAAADTLVSEWVSSFALDAYLAISPGVTGSGATVPPGTTIVRAVLGEDGGVGKLTVMVKGPPGYNSDLGDWWFAVTDPDGLPLDTDAGAEMGKLSGCYSCHVPRAHNGYLFGVPLDDRTSGGEVVAK
jgi:hypothetical protein